MTSMTMATHTNTSGAGMCALAKYCAVPPGFLSLWMPDQRKRLDINRRPSGAKYGFKLSMVRFPQANVGRLRRAAEED